MKKYIGYLAAGLVCLTSCSVLEKSSDHGFNSGLYTMYRSDKSKVRSYVDVSGEDIAVYSMPDDIVEGEAIYSLSLKASDSVCHYPVVFSKKSLDVDITTILLKYRPGISGRPAQLSTDFNAALYGGLRFDRYYIKSISDPLGKCRYNMVNRGYDIGLFAGLGTTEVGPFSTLNILGYEYSGMVLQYGVAGFLETSMASFGLSAGLDNLAGWHRNIWIYQQKPWVGFIVGIALN